MSKDLAPRFTVPPEPTKSAPGAEPASASPSPASLPGNTETSGAAATTPSRPSTHSDPTASTRAMPLDQGQPGGASGAGLPPASPDPAAQSEGTAEAKTLTEQGIHLCRTARWRSAIDPLRRSTELNPEDAIAFYYLGDACNHVDALAHALEAFESAARLDPTHWRALKGIGIVLDRMRRPHEAAAAYQRAREVQNKSAPRLA